MMDESALQTRYKIVIDRNSKRTGDEMNIDELTVGEAKEIARMFSNLAPVPQAGRKLGIKIVVLDNGFIYVGDVEIVDGMLYIRNAKNIRKWGTTKGLGELYGGPLSNTMLDKCGDIVTTISALNHGHIMDVDEDGWSL